ncbi:MORN repeat-containing protein 5 [Plasmodiophora brassicae]
MGVDQLMLAFAAVAAASVIVSAVPVPPQSAPVVIDKQLWTHVEGTDQWTHNTDGHVYAGAVVDIDDQKQLPHGYGRYSCKDVATNTGQWADGCLNGEGEVMAADGSFSFRGRFKHGLRAGFGVYSHEDGWRYEGHYLDDKRNGHGKWTDIDGQLLEGQWRADLFEGHGRVMLANGMILEGQFTKWAPGASIAGGSFRGNLVDAMGQVTELKQPTLKKDILNASAASRKHGRDADDDGKPGNPPRPMRLKTGS